MGMDVKNNEPKTTSRWIQTNRNVPQTQVNSEKTSKASTTDNFRQSEQNNNPVIQSDAVPVQNATPEASHKEVTVKAGDTASALLLEAGVKSSDLRSALQATRKANPSIDLDKLVVGQKIKLAVPAGSEALTEAPEGYRAHKVKTGESVFTLLMKDFKGADLQKAIAETKKVNGLNDKLTLYAGQTLLLPSKSGSVQEQKPPQVAPQTPKSEQQRPTAEQEEPTTDKTDKTKKTESVASAEQLKKAEEVKQKNILKYARSQVSAHLNGQPYLSYCGLKAWFPNPKDTGTVHVSIKTDSDSGDSGGIRTFRVTGGKVSQVSFKETQGYNP